MSLLKNPKKAKVMILGTYHFGSAGKHAVEVEIEDVLSEKKQQEIEELLQKLIEFKPNKIVVETVFSNSEKLNELYCLYCKDQHVLTRNEVEQIGFRLAKMLDHTNLYPVDVPVSLPAEEVFEYAEKHNSKFFEQFQREIAEYTSIVGEMQKSSTIIEIFRFFNDPKRIYKEHSDWYLKFAQVGAGDNYCGANFLTAWYDRNIKILGNLQKITEPGDRILVLYGAGHAKILRDFVLSSSNMELIETMQYL